MSDYKLKKDEKIDIEAILDGLESYVPKKTAVDMAQAGPRP